ncbi:hypothetical protein [endosymbiont GvMRE of Glomus versiforme]|uniref:hypothetical protein n=1 Tax=endosymbiont GvMRE of Glomus versiforme TaxID=2039283 RepID=UPI000EB961C5|nr:hypothetical protein [endosymbiont GvMRE of Glomus versiforme]RHZ36029.1 hypothetical protein GvMRE_Ic3g11 [endosymbiont GvMRE of Glomus versiforme]
MNNDEQRKYLAKFNEYFPIDDQENGVIKQIKEDIERIKEITNLEEKCHESNLALSIHCEKELHVDYIYTKGKLGKLGIVYEDTVEKYHELIRELRTLDIETIKELEKNKTKPKKQNKKSDKQSEKQEEPIRCSGLACYKEIKLGTRYYYHKTKNDGKKFCSDECYVDYYGEYCHGCMNKFLVEELYVPNANNPKYLLCFNCWKKEKQEQREWEESQKSYCELCGAELTGENVFSLYCASCWEKETEKVQKRKRKEESKKNKQFDREREREREREQTWTQFA